MKLNRIKDWLLMEEELLQRFEIKDNTDSIIDQAKLSPSQRKFVEKLRGTFFGIHSYETWLT